MALIFAAFSLMLSHGGRIASGGGKSVGSAKWSQCRSSGRATRAAIPDARRPPDFGDFGDPDSAIWQLSAERGSVDLMPEMGYRPSNLPPWSRTDTAAVDAPPLEPALAEGRFLGWVDKLLSR